MAVSSDRPAGCRFAGAKWEGLARPTEELLALVEWLRSFNEGRPVDDRVRVLGFDAPSVATPAAALLDGAPRHV